MIENSLLYKRFSFPQLLNNPKLAEHLSQPSPPGMTHLTDGLFWRCPPQPVGALCYLPSTNNPTGFNSQLLFWNWIMKRRYLGNLLFLLHRWVFFDLGASSQTSYYGPWPDPLCTRFCRDNLLSWVLVMTFFLVI